MFLASRLFCSFSATISVKNTSMLVSRIETIPHMSRIFIHTIILAYGVNPTPYLRNETSHDPTKEHEAPFLTSVCRSSANSARISEYGETHVLTGSTATVNEVSFDALPIHGRSSVSAKLPSSIDDPTGMETLLETQLSSSSTEARLFDQDEAQGASSLQIEAKLTLPVCLTEKCSC